MSRDKQISEMAKICCNTCEFGCGFNGECDLGNDYRTCGVSKETAEALYNAGYRKSTDVAEEIFAEIEKSIADLEYRANTPRKTVKVEELKEQVNWVLHEVVPKTLAELKKKYTVTDTNVGCKDTESEDTE